MDDTNSLDRRIANLEKYTKDATPAPFPITASGTVLHAPFGSWTFPPLAAPLLVILLLFVAVALVLNLPKTRAKFP